ncbi:hypothetical protein RRG08_021230 [Elysia crispata]|uniref:Uncharacterized protein n=1 Tax=Elysia crispata TaxID=231223 RepID=A0AAE1D7J5_9GAST|nr:hypothetical protein RRG08_021230 [Elysia crispata]
MVQTREVSIKTRYGIVRGSIQERANQSSGSRPILYSQNPYTGFMVWEPSAGCVAVPLLPIAYFSTIYHSTSYPGAPLVYLYEAT